MAKRTARRYVPAADRPSGTLPAEPVYTALCEAGRHPRCAGLIFSLTAQNGARCECPCHAQPLPEVWKRLDASEAGALSAPNPFALPPCEQDGEVA